MHEDINEIKKVASSYEVLTKEAERALILKFHKGDKRAGDLIVRHNYRLVWNIAKKYIGRGLDFKDLIQEGSIGLLKGINKFDLSRNLKLSTYASWWIRQGISRAIENKAKMIRIPINQLSKHTQLKKVYRKYIEDHQEVPTSEELAILCGITTAQAEEFGRQMQDVDSLDKSASEDENLTVMDYIADQSALEHTEEDSSVSMDKSFINSVLDQLPEEQKAFVVYKYGLLDYQEKTIEECAVAFQTTKEEIMVLETIILNKLRAKISRDQVNLDEGICENKYSVIIQKLGNRRLELMEFLKSQGMKLSEQKTLMSNLPYCVRSELTFKEASDLLKELKDRDVSGVVVAR